MSRDTTDDPRRLTHKLIYISDRLGLYHAELARVLHVQCADIGRLTSGREMLTPGTQAWRQAECFVYFHRLLHDKLRGDEVSMYHWLRAENAALKGVPLLLIIDEDRLTELITYLESEREIEGVTRNRS